MYAKNLKDKDFCFYCSLPQNSTWEKFWKFGFSIGRVLEKHNILKLNCYKIFAVGIRRFAALLFRCPLLKTSSNYLNEINIRVDIFWRMKLYLTLRGHTFVEYLNSKFFCVYPFTNSGKNRQILLHGTKSYNSFIKILGI